MILMPLFPYCYHFANNVIGKAVFKFFFGFAVCRCRNKSPEKFKRRRYYQTVWGWLPQLLPNKSTNPITNIYTERILP